MPSAKCVINLAAETITDNGGFGKFGGSNDGCSSRGVRKDCGRKMRSRKLFSLGLNKQEIFAGQSKFFREHGLNCELVTTYGSAAG